MAKDKKKSKTFGIISNRDPIAYFPWLEIWLVFRSKVTVAIIPNIDDSS